MSDQLPVHVLVIEDDPGMRFLLEKMLSNLGVRILLAKTFGEAISAMNASPKPDFICLDLKLPDSPDSHQTLQSIKDLRSFNPTIPILVLTGDTEDKLEQVSKTAGAEAFRLKTDLASQLDLWMAIKECIDIQGIRGITPTDAMHNLVQLVNSKTVA